eukprot:TRINITY_DN43342_c0_g1_i1.p1 TRINITY_DN43342_c0_g1~~TRINITY_DN43342_c0_g1_i1.p1  ORF type:complete len:156 (+),score=25.47 TRINITY_DN43342_c0_g1_i1:74-541(+)
MEIERFLEGVPLKRQSSEPSKEEIEEHALILGMDLEADCDLLWIARDCLKAPLPKPWKPRKSSSRELYYFNCKTGQSVWDHPCDEQYKRMYQELKSEKEESVKLLSETSCPLGSIESNRSLSQKREGNLMDPVPEPLEHKGADDQTERLLLKLRF